MDRTKCLVCTVPISLTQLGIDVCRACAAFFKRTTIAGRTFTCRQGDGKCVFRKHEKYMCRSCRYDKCASLGMTYTPRRKGRRKRATASEEHPTMTPSCSSSSTTDTQAATANTLLEASFDRRLEQEKVIVERQRLKPFHHQTESFFMGNVTSFYDTFQVAIRESMPLFQQICAGFGEVTVEEKAALFKSFLGKFYMAEGAFLSAKYFGNVKHFMTSLITCLDLDRLHEWIHEEGIERKDDFLSSLTGFAREYADILEPIQKINKISETEFYALIILACCDIDVTSDLPERVISSIDEMRRQVFEELQDYYRIELNLADFSLRFGNLMTISHNMSEAGILMNEELRMYATMFGVYADDRLLREILFE
ncbi:hypothetical protein PFISCL1PPCAC_13195 [Pristionchus fissidentatus]|uniref:Nuclear receptor n=1 Tax=Pristionchus fissidentatus TaxID=1538716 RepID=A0AAV5VUD7_9BILA|nr:hypothetical protein PFISCL1PPCAC_13195 [Pristionchus fissidentatus]